MTFSPSHAGYTVLDPPQVAPQEILQGAALPLYHLIIVEGSWLDLLYTISHAGHTASDSSQVAPQGILPPTPTTVQWERDRYILTLLSIMVPEDQLDTLGKSLSLSRITIDQIMSGYRAGSVLNVGERAYEMFKRASRNKQPLTFSKILVGLNEIGRSDDLVPILRSYIQSRLSVQSLSRASSGTPSEAESGDGPSTLFINWLCANHPALLSRTYPSGIAVERAILPKEQSTLFIGLSRRMVCVWRMVGRLLGLPDEEIDAIDSEGRRSHDGGRESCYQMLLRWVEHSRSPAYITYYRLLAALELTSLGTGAALDAMHLLTLPVEEASP